MAHEIDLSVRTRNRAGRSQPQDQDAVLQTQASGLSRWVNRAVMAADDGFAVRGEGA